MSDSDPLISTILDGRYRILEQIGKGGMGTVYLAEHNKLGKRVALKVLSIGDLSNRREEMVTRFVNEARAVALIAHPHIVDVTDFGEHDGNPFFVMERLEGSDLERVIKEGGAIPFVRARRIAMQIAEALGAAHGRGIIHRDAKPANVFLIFRDGDPDYVKLLDFGLVKLTDESSGTRTRTGFIFGTPQYMSPEQAKGERVDQRTDIYALGCILYEMLTGAVPFDGETFMKILSDHMLTPVEPPTSRRPDLRIRADVEAVVMKALAKDGQERFQSMAEFAAALEAIEVEGDEPVVRPRTKERPVAVERPTRELISASASTALDMRSPLPTPAPAAPTARPKRRWVIPAALALILVAGFGGFLALRQPAPSVSAPNKPSLPMTVAAPTPPHFPAPTPPAPKAIAASLPAVTAPAPVPSEVTIAVDSVPSGAAIFRKSERLGTTPAALKFPRSENPFTLIISKDGYSDEDIRVTPSSDQSRSVKLREETQSSGSAWAPPSAEHPRERATSPAPTPQPPAKRKSMNLDPAISD